MVREQEGEGTYSVLRALALPDSIPARSKHAVNQVISIANSVSKSTAKIGCIIRSPGGVFDVTSLPKLCSGASVREFFSSKNCCRSKSLIMVY